jgi:hypothetical protein
MKAICLKSNGAFEKGKIYNVYPLVANMVEIHWYNTIYDCGALTARLIDENFSFAPSGSPFLKSC